MDDINEDNGRKQMRITPALAGSAAAITAMAGLGLASAGSAAAANVNGASWRAYGNTNPVLSSSADWRCGPTKQIGVNVGAQLCWIIGATNPQGLQAEQGAVIVRNNKPVQYNAAASIQLTGPVANFSACGTSGVAAHSWSVCFSPTVHAESSDGLFVNGTANADVLIGP
jgi:hypothetical protein